MKKGLTIAEVIVGLAIVGILAAWFSSLEIRLQHMKRDIDFLNERLNER